jgi:hypothetical protein
VVAVSAAIYALRENGIVISCVAEGRSDQGASVYRYRYVGYEPDGDPGDKFKALRRPGWTPHTPADGSALYDAGLAIVNDILDSDPPAPLVDADPPPDVPAHMIGDVIRFERMPRAERDRYQRVCEGRAGDGSCLLCAYVISGEHEDLFPPASRKAHVLVCCDPALDSNAKYLRPRHADPSESRDPLPAARTTHPGLTVGVGSA